MKQLLTTIAAVLLVGCGPQPPDISIYRAVQNGNIEAVKQHLAAGTDVNASHGIGGTPLHAAAFWRRKEIIELLIAKGANVNAKIVSGGHKGETPLDWAVTIDRKETVDLLRKHGGKTKKELEAAEPVADAAQPESPTAKAPDILLIEAAAEGNIEAVKQHLTAGVDVNANNKNGTTPLHRAAYWGHKEVVELLIANGADVHAKWDNGWTPLHRAALYDHKEVTELLIANGADVNAKIDDGRTPLDMAIFGNETESADLLRKHGGKTRKELKAEGK